MPKLYLVTHRQIGDWCDEPRGERAYLYGDLVLRVLPVSDNRRRVNVTVRTISPGGVARQATRHDISREALVRVEAVHNGN